MGTRTKFQLKIRNINVIYDIVYFREIILESLQNRSETTPGLVQWNNRSRFIVEGALPQWDDRTEMMRLLDVTYRVISYNVSRGIELVGCH